MEFTFLGVGWGSKVSQKRSTYSISINKLVAVGNSLVKGELLFSYLGEDNNCRKVIIIYLDGKEK